MKISVIVPCYNEEETLPLFKARFEKIAAELSVSWELLFVDDGSKDQTLAICKEFASRDPNVKVLSFSRNFGKEAALLCGLSEASGDLISVMDADLQDPPELIASMLTMMQETGCDCVAARRSTRAGEPPARSFFARMFYRLMRGAEVRVEDGVRDFRLMKREVAGAIIGLPEKRRFSKGLMVWVGFDTRYIEYENVERAAGKTKFSFVALLRYAIEGVTSLTSAPLLIPYGFGALCLFLSLAFGAAGAAAQAVVCAFSALTLLCLGVLGSYLGRIFFETKKRPLYIQKKKT